MRRGVSSAPSGLFRAVSDESAGYRVVLQVSAARELLVPVRSPFLERLQTPYMSFDRIVVIGASAGGLEPLKTVVSRLPEDFPAPIFVVMHVSPHTPSVLPQILASKSKLKAVHATDGDDIVASRIYCA